MKRIIFLMFMVFAISIATHTPVKAQIYSQISQSVSLKPTTFQYVYTGQSTDTLGAGDSIWNMQIFPNKTYALYYNVAVNMHKITTCNDSIILYGKYFLTDPTWTAISGCAFTGTVTDTIVTFPSFTTKTGYNYFNAYVKRKSGTSSVTNLKAYFRY